MKNIKSNSITKVIGTAMLILLALTGYAQQYNTRVQGNLPQMKAGIPIKYVWNDKDHMKPYTSWDSILSTKGGFTLQLNVDEAAGNDLVLLIGSKPAAGKLLFMYVDRGLVTITSKDSTFTDVTLSGNTGARELEQFHRFMAGSPQLANYTEVKNKAMEAREQKAADAEQLTTQLNQMDSTRKVMAMQWINEHPNSAVCAFIMQSPFEPFGGRPTNDEKKAILNKMTANARNNKIATDMMYTLTNENMIKVGKTAPQFTQNDTLGKPISLNDFKGKYVLLDFWASWCAPCRVENPNVVKAYNKYKDKNFTILSVSLDQPGKKDAWLKAIHTDHLIWTHVSDLKFWGNAVAKLYNINAVPANFLIGPDGVIIATNLKGQDLDDELSKLLNK
jgi:peroxiredoxin